MRCEHCQGSGWVTKVFKTIELPSDTLQHVQYRPCPECYGAKIVSCCEGSQRHGQLDDACVKEPE